MHTLHAAYNPRPSQIPARRRWACRKKMVLDLQTYLGTRTKSSNTICSLGSLHSAPSSCRFNDREGSHQ